MREFSISLEIDITDIILFIRYTFQRNLFEDKLVNTRH